MICSDWLLAEMHKEQWPIGNAIKCLTISSLHSEPGKARTQPVPLFSKKNSHINYLSQMWSFPFIQNSTIFSTFPPYFHHFHFTWFPLCTLNCLFSGFSRLSSSSFPKIHNISAWGVSKRIKQDPKRLY